MKPGNFNKIESSLSNLSDMLKPKLTGTNEALEYAKAGEYRLALEFLADWCVDAEPSIFLSCKELMAFKEAGDEMNMQGPWVELLPLIISSEIQSIPSEYANQARDYIKKQLLKNPQREPWLNKVKSVLSEIAKTV